MKKVLVQAFLPFFITAVSWGCISYAKTDLNPSQKQEQVQEAASEQEQIPEGASEQEQIPEGASEQEQIREAASEQEQIPEAASEQELIPEPVSGQDQDTSPEPTGMQTLAQAQKLARETAAEILTDKIRSIVLDSYQKVYDLPGQVSDTLYDNVYRLSAEQPALDLLDLASNAAIKTDMSWINELGIDLALSDLQLELPDEFEVLPPYNSYFGADPQELIRKEDEFGAVGVLHVNETPVFRADAILGAGGLHYWLPELTDSFGMAPFDDEEIPDQVLSIVRLFLKKEKLLPDPAIVENLLDTVMEGICGLCEFEEAGSRTITLRGISEKGVSYMGYLTFDDLMTLLNRLAAALENDPAAAEYIDFMYETVRGNDAISGLFENAGFYDALRTAVSSAGYAPEDYFPVEEEYESETDMEGDGESVSEEAYAGWSGEEETDISSVDGAADLYPDEEETAAWFDENDTETDYYADVHDARGMKEMAGTENRTAFSAVLMNYLRQMLGMYNLMYEGQKLLGEFNGDENAVCIFCQFDEEGRLAGFVLREVDGETPQETENALHGLLSEAQWSWNDLFTFLCAEDGIRRAYFINIINDFSASWLQSLGKNYSTLDARVSTSSSGTTGISGTAAKDERGHGKFSVSRPRLWYPLTVRTEQFGIDDKGKCSGTIGICLGQLGRALENSPYQYYVPYDVREILSVLPENMYLNLNCTEGCLEIADDERSYLTLAPVAKEQALAGAAILEEDLNDIIVKYPYRFFVKSYQELYRMNPLPVVNRLLDAGMPHDILNQISEEQMEDITYAIGFR